MSDGSVSGSIHAPAAADTAGVDQPSIVLSPSGNASPSSLTHPIAVSRSSPRNSSSVRISTTVGTTDSGKIEASNSVNSSRRKSISRSFYSIDSGSLSYSQQGGLVTMSSSAIRQQTIEFSYREMSIASASLNNNNSELTPESNHTNESSSQSISEHLHANNSAESPMRRKMEFVTGGLNTTPMTLKSIYRLKSTESPTVSVDFRPDSRASISRPTLHTSEQAHNNQLLFGDMEAISSSSSQPSNIQDVGLGLIVEGDTQLVPEAHMSSTRTSVGALYRNCDLRVLPSIESRNEADDEMSPLLIFPRSPDPQNQSMQTFLPINIPFVGNNSAKRSQLRQTVSRGNLNFFLAFRSLSVTILNALPAVILGVILNMLDALSYGIIIFPSSSDRIPDSATQAGISMFLASSIIAQLVFAFGGSGFKGGNGSMMIEVMPFFHIMVKIIEEQASNASNEAILATVMVTFAMSTILTGIVFFILGIFKLGNLIQFFPRHILVGCIGGIGWFLFVTGIEVTCGIKPELSFESLMSIFEHRRLALWMSSLSLALLLKMMQTKFTQPLFVPLFYVIVPIVFFVIVFALGISLEQLRELGLLFQLPPGKEAPFWIFWTYFNNFQGIQWQVIPATLGTQFALVFFAVLHVPINVPALAVSTRQTVDVNQEIVGHGISNILSGLIGTPQNYLVYSNSVLFIRSGGNSSTAAFLLAIGTGIIWVAGGKVIGFVPTLVVGSLIFHLSFDLLKESVYDTWKAGISSLEYLTIVLIVFIMAFLGFTEGILSGMVLACFFFVIMYSRRNIIRSVYTGIEIKSTVHRPYRQRLYLDQVGDQIKVIKLQGFMFFGVISQLEVLIDDVLLKSPYVRFIVLDFALISGIDFSAMEAFHRLKRLLMKHEIHLIFCDLGNVSFELAKSGIFDLEEYDDDDDEEDGENQQNHIESRSTIVEPNNTASFDSTRQFSVSETSPLISEHPNPTYTSIHVSNQPSQQHPAIRAQNFETLNEALEFCENCLLMAYYRMKEEYEDMIQFEPVGSRHGYHEDGGDLSHDGTYLERCQERYSSANGVSPRTIRVRHAAMNVLKDDPLHKLDATIDHHPISILLRSTDTSHAQESLSSDQLSIICHQFSRVQVTKGTVLWHHGSPAVEMYIVESGELVQVCFGESAGVGLESGLMMRSFGVGGIGGGGRGGIREGKVVETLLPGTMVGELEMFAERAHACKLVASEDSVLWCLTKESFRQFTQQHPNLSMMLIRISLGFDCVRFNSAISRP